MAEVGAVNAVANAALKRQFHVAAFPAFFLFSSKHQVHVQFPWKGPQTFVDTVQPWVTEKLADWESVFRSTAVERFTEPPAFALEVLNSTDMWIAMFTDGRHCTACAAAMPNFYRLSTDLVGVARVGVIDCSLPALAQVCTDQIAKDVRSRAFPYFFIYPRGPKPHHGPAGDLLFDGGDGGLEPHAVFPVIAMVARNALADKQTDRTAVSKADSDSDSFEYARPNDPPPPPPERPQYHAPERRSKVIQLGSSGQRTHRLT